MRLRAPRFLVITASLCGGTSFAACSLTSLSGYSGGDDGADTGSSSTGDAPGEASDGSEATADAPLDDAPARSFCESLSPKPTLCDDFERTTLLGPWGAQVASGGGTVAIENRQLRVALPDFTTQGQVGVASLQQDFDVATDVDFRFSIRIEALPPKGGIQLNAILVHPTPNDFFTAYLYAQPTGITYAEQSFPNGASGDFALHELPTLTTVASHVVDIHLSLVAPPRATVKVDGVVAWDGPSLAFFRSGKTTVGAGIHYTSPPAGPLVFRIDDVAIVAK